MYLTRKDLLEIHRKVIKEGGGNSVVVFPGNLDMCVESPKLQMYGLEIHETVY